MTVVGGVAHHDDLIAGRRVSRASTSPIGITRPGDPLSWHLVVDRERYEYLGFRDTLVRDDGVTVRRVSARVAHGVVDRIGERP